MAALAAALGRRGVNVRPVPVDGGHGAFTEPVVVLDAVVSGQGVLEISARS